MWGKSLKISHSSIHILCIIVPLNFFFENHIFFGIYPHFWHVFLHLTPTYRIWKIHNDWLTFNTIKEKKKRGKKVPHSQKFKGMMERNWLYYCHHKYVWEKIENNILFGFLTLWEKAHFLKGEKKGLIQCCKCWKGFWFWWGWKMLCMEVNILKRTVCIQILFQEMIDILINILHNAILPLTCIHLVLID